MATTVGAEEIQGIVQHFEEIADPRSTINRTHLLTDVIVMSICAVIAGADGPAGIEEWAKRQYNWLKQHLKLPGGIPSHDTFGRILEALNPQAFQQCFAGWLDSLSADGDERPQVAIDGKTMRRSHDRGRGWGPLHLVSAWATEQGIALGQLATEEKSNEITAIPQLLDQLDIESAIISIDAAGCQKEIAGKIIAGGGDYVLALKGNQGNLFEAVQDYFLDHQEDGFSRVTVSRWEDKEKSHGRIEHRTYYQLTLPANFPERGKWAGLTTIGVAVRITEENGQETSDVRYFISSLPRNAKHFAKVVRRHWTIETTLHWSLDLTFREDESRVRGRRIADNLSWLRRIALTLLKQHPYQQSLAMKRRIAGWSIDFLMQVLTGNVG